MSEKSESLQMLEIYLNTLSSMYISYADKGIELMKDENMENKINFLKRVNREFNEHLSSLRNQIFP